MENCLHVFLVVLSREYTEESEVMIKAIRTSCAYVGFFVFLLCITSTKFYSYKYNVTWNQTANRKPDFRCIWSVVDNKTKCKPVCDHGYFGLYGMKTCHQWLNCTDIKSIKGFEKIQTDTIGYVKKVRVISKTLAKLIFDINKHL